MFITKVVTKCHLLWWLIISMSTYMAAPDWSAFALGNLKAQSNSVLFYSSLGWIFHLIETTGYALGDRWHKTLQALTLSTLHVFHNCHHFFSRFLLNACRLWYYMNLVIYLHLQPYRLARFCFRSGVKNSSTKGSASFLLQAKQYLRI